MPSLVSAQPTPASSSTGKGVHNFFKNKIEAAELTINAKTQNLRRLEAQRNALNTRGEHLELLAGRVGIEKDEIYDADDDWVCLLRSSTIVERGAPVITGTWIVCGRGDQSYGKEEGAGQGAA